MQSYASPRTANFGRGQFGQFSPYRDSPQSDPGADDQPSPMDQAIAPKGSSPQYQQSQPDPSGGYGVPGSGARGINDGRASQFPGASDGSTGITGGMYGPGSYTSGQPSGGDTGASGGSDSSLGLMGLDNVGSAIMGGGGADFNLARQLGIDTDNPMWRQILLQLMSQTQGQMGQIGQPQGQTPSPRFSQLLDPSRYLL